MHPVYFGNLSYATPAKGNGNPYLKMYTTQPPGVPFPWYFAHREKGKGAVHTLTLSTDAQGQQWVHLLITKRPALGGKLTLELPAGLWGDQKTNANETPLEAAQREVLEETGMPAQAARMLTDNLFATSPGMTTEHKAFAVAETAGLSQGDQREIAEKAIIVGETKIPIATLANYDAFMAWLTQMSQQGYTVGMDILAARALMPPLTGGRLNITNA